MRLEIGAYMEYSSSFVDWQTYPLRMMEVPNDFITNLQLATCLSTEYWSRPAHDLATVASVNPSRPRTSPHRPQKNCTIVPRVGRNVIARLLIAKMVSVNP